MFVEIQAKQAAVDCGALEAMGIPHGDPKGENPSDLWDALWG